MVDELNRTIILLNPSGQARAQWEHSWIESKDELEYYGSKAYRYIDPITYRLK